MGEEQMGGNELGEKRYGKGEWRKGGDDIWKNKMSQGEMEGVTVGEVMMVRKGGEIWMRLTSEGRRVEQG